MTTQDAIELAMQNGYKRSYTGESSHWIEYHITLLDPLFWQALGTGLGWEDKKNYSFEELKPVIGGWLYHWHCLIDTLSEGKTVEEFFSTI